MRKSLFSALVIVALASAVSLSFPAEVAQARQIIGALVWTGGSGAPSATQVPTPTAGSLYTRSDTGQAYIYTGSAWAAYGVNGVGESYKVARGTVTLDGTNPSSATTGLATIVSCAVTDKRSTAPGLDPSAFTIATAAVAGRLDVYAWKVTGAADSTLIASTDADDTIDWVCVGT